MTTTKTAVKIAPLPVLYPRCDIKDTQSVYYPEYKTDENGDTPTCFAHVLEKGAIVRFQMDFMSEFAFNCLCELEVISMQRSHLKELFSKFLPGMTPVWATVNVLWEDDF